MAGERSISLLSIWFISYSSLSTFASKPSIADIRKTIDCVIELRELRLSTELLANQVPGSKTRGRGLAFELVISCVGALV